MHNIHHVYLQIRGIKRPSRQRPSRWKTKVSDGLLCHLHKQHRNMIMMTELLDSICQNWSNTVDKSSGSAQKKWHSVWLNEVMRNPWLFRYQFVGQLDMLFGLRCGSWEEASQKLGRWCLDTGHFGGGYAGSVEFGLALLPTLHTSKLDTPWHNL